MTGTPGLPRSYFYSRIASAMHDVIAHNVRYQSDQQPGTVMKVNLQEAIARLTCCPVCGSKLTMYPDYPLERSCSCGDFTISEVWSDGDVIFEFKMASPEKLAADQNDGP